MDKEKRVIKLPDVKSIMSIAATVVWAYLAVTGTMNVKDSMVIILIVFQFFFQHQQTKDK